MSQSPPPDDVAPLIVGELPMSEHRVSPTTATAVLAELFERNPSLVGVIVADDREFGGHELLGVVGGACPLEAGKHVETIADADEASRKLAEGQKPLEFEARLEGEMLTLTLPGAKPQYVETWKRVK